MKKRGLVPDAGLMAGVTALQGWMAYKTARRQGLQGVEPQLAAQHAYNDSVYTIFFWVTVALPGSIAVILGILQPPFMWPYAVGVGWFMYRIYNRLTVWRNWRADEKLEWPGLPTWALLLLGAVWTWLAWIVFIGPQIIVFGHHG